MPDQWHYTRRGQRHGPVTHEELAQLFRSGELHFAELVWKEGMPRWLPASQVIELASVAAPPIPDEELSQVGVLSYSTRQMEDLVFTARALEMLRQTRPWVRFIAILLLITAALLGIAGIIFVVMAAIGAGARGEPPALVAVIYIVMAALYVIPAIYLGRYASAITELISLNRADVLERALESQKSFWKFVGIAALVIIAIYIVAALVMVVIVVLR